MTTLNFENYDFYETYHSSNDVLISTNIKIVKIK